MSLSVQVNQYWQLTRTVLFPMRFIRWLFGVLLALTMLVGVFQLIEQRAFVTIAGSLVCFLLVISAIQVPGQMLALASSKQFHHLAGLRTKLFALAFVFWFVLALLISSFLFHISKDDSGFGDVLALAIITTSLIATTFSVVMAYYPPAMGIYPLVIFIAIPEFFKNVSVIGNAESLYLWGISGILWMIFYYWWKKWHPKEYLANAMTLSPEEMKRRYEERKSAKSVVTSLPRSLSGTLLIGASDGFTLWLKREIIQPVIFLTLMLAFMLWRDITSEKIPPMLFTAFLFFLVAGRGCSFLHWQYKNLYRLWMNSNQSRTENFSYLERFYCPYFFASTAPAALFLLLASYYFLNIPMNIFHIGHVLMIATLFVAYSYYLGLVIYAKYSANTVTISWILLATYVCVITIMIHFNILWGWDISQSHADYLLFSGVLFGLTILLRQLAKSCWKTVNFYRVPV
jgi:hypothetical protein